MRALPPATRLAVAAALPVLIGFAVGRTGIATVASLFLVLLLPIVALVWMVSMIAAVVIAVARANARADALMWMACVVVATVAGAGAAAWGGILFHAHDSRNAVAFLTGSVGATLGAACGAVVGGLGAAR